MPRILAAGLLALALLSCAGSPPSLEDPHLAARDALAAEAGELGSVALPQTGPAIAAHLARVDGDGAGYAFEGRRFVGRVATAEGEIGCILVMPPSGRPRGTIIGFHGYLAHSVYTLGLMERLADRGWAAIAADLPGHGFSEGERGDIRDFSDYSVAIQGLMAWAAAQDRYDLPRPIVLLGHSAGGAAVLAELFDEGAAARPGAAVLLAPLLRPVQSWALPLAGALALFTPNVKSRDGDDGYLGVRYMPLRWVRSLGRWLALMRRAKPLSSIPALIVQGTADDVLEWRANLRLLKAKLPGARVVLLPGRGHVLPVGGPEREESLAAIASFLDELYPEGSALMVSAGTD